jgi:cytochrome c-type biogenesis protein CcmH/NrfG
VNWGKVDSLLQLTTSLQPTYTNYWDEASWHMAYNAASYYLYDEKLEPFVRGKLYEEHVQRGITILKDGLRYLPQDVRLWNSLAEIYERRSHEPRLAAAAYLEVHRLTKNNRYARFAAYQYAQTADPELWKKAYDLLREAYQTKSQRTPSLIENLKTLEERLKIPMMQRIPDQRKPMEISPMDQGPVR